MEYEGEVVTLGNVDVKLRMFKNKVILLEGEVKRLTSALQETKRLAEEREKELLTRVKFYMSHKKPQKKKGKRQRNEAPQPTVEEPLARNDGGLKYAELNNL